MWCDFMNLFGERILHKPSILMIAGLLAVGLISVATVVLRKQHFTGGWQVFRRSFVALLWAAPVLAVLGVVGVEVSRLVQPPIAEGVVDDDGRISLDYVNATSRFEPVPANERSYEVTAKPHWFDDRAMKLRTRDRRHRQTITHWRVCLESGEETSVDKARADVGRQATQMASRMLHRQSGYQHLPALNDPEATRQLVIREATQTVTHQMSNGGEFDMYKVYWQIELTPDSQAAMVNTWKANAGQSRGWLVVGLLGLCTVLSASVMAYFRLNARSNGQHWLRLRLASLSFMVAAGLGFLQFLRTLN